MPLAFLTADEFNLRTLLPSTVIAAIEAQTPGWLDAQIIGVSARIQARLAKRYPDWAAPYPEAIKQWVVDIISANAWLKRGMSATDEGFTTYKEKHDTAYDEIKEAANSDVGLFDLEHTVDSVESSAIGRGNTQVYSEQSPYAGFDRQAEIARSEDRGGRGGTSS